MCMLGSAPSKVHFIASQHSETRYLKIRNDFLLPVYLLAIYLGFPGYKKTLPTKGSWAFLGHGWPQGPHRGMVWKILIGYCMNVDRQLETFFLISLCTQHESFGIFFYNYLFDLLLLLEVWHFSLKVFPILNYSGVSGAFAVIWALISLASKHHEKLDLQPMAH